jgi:NAD(P)-dependent dehydrogenase (short-subunit alcohol dehydrogenase family)
MSEPRTILITGATDGLGRALAGRLAADGARLLLHGRDQARLDAVADEIATAAADGGGPRPRPLTVRADFAELAQVRAMTEQVGSLTSRLDVLVSNAGIGSGAPASKGRAVSADGYELRFAVNYLAGFALTLGLLPLLRATGGARVVNVASLGQAPVDFDDVMIEKGYSGSRAYGQSKLAQITSGFTLAGRLPAAEVTVNSLHPATYMPTKMVLEEVGHSLDTLARGEAATRRLVSDPALATVTGRFYDRKTETRAHPAAYDPEIQQQLWDLSLDLTGTPEPAR